VIEDEESVRANILELLEAEGFGVAEAEDGFGGVRQARERLPDLIICDIMMPGLDGLGVLTMLRQDIATATIPFIFLTARTERTDLRMGMELGADDYLTKPFTRAELLKAIQARLSKHASVSEKFQKKLDDLRDSITLSLPHELRTPLTFILGFTEMLIEHYDSLEREEILEMAQRIQTGAQRLERLILNFLLYAELEVAARDPERIKALLGSGMCPARSVVTELAIQKAQRAVRATDLSLDIQDATIQVPEVGLYKIVEELVDNAFKYSQSGTPVRVAGRLDNNRFVLTIMDNGLGMTAAQISDIGAYMQFERKLHEQQGSGFGLTIAKRLTELHGGELTIQSVPGQQTTVRVVLPM
jgi:signal transduction histidine kinase